VANAEYGENNGPDWRLGVFIQERQKTASNGGNDPAAPDGPSVATKPGCKERDDNASGEEKAGHRENI
jgi:hypothetical protein